MVPFTFTCIKEKTKGQILYGIPYTIMFIETSLLLADPEIFGISPRTACRSVMISQNQLDCKLQLSAPFRLRHVDAF
jgi:hypothetical protein